MNKLITSYNKTLKLTNAMFYRIANDDLQNIDKVVYQMENYIRSKGAIPIGPVVQCTQIAVTEVGEVEININFIRQANTYINHLEHPYTMESVLRIPNCLFVRFHGEESQLHFAYDKLNLIAFEEDIPLTGKSYTVFTAQSEDQFSADVFMEKDTPAV